MRFLVSKIRELCDPVLNPPWDAVQAVSYRLVMGVEPFDPARGECIGRNDHLGRIRWFMENGWSDPIEVDVGCPILNYLPSWIVVDGNHRFAAAILMGHEWIEVNPAGQVDFYKLFTE